MANETEIKGRLSGLLNRPFIIFLIGSRSRRHRNDVGYFVVSARTAATSSAVMALASLPKFCRI